MFNVLSRRELLRNVGAAVAGAAFVSDLPAPNIGRPDGRAGSIRFGYAAITWGGNDEQAIDDIASLGFRGIQLRSNAFAKYADRPAALRELLESRKLTMVALSSGNLSIDPAAEREQLDIHTRHADFLRKVGGLYLQIIDEKPSGRPLVDADYERLGRLLTELGKRTTDLGIPLGYHHHMGSIGEQPDAIRKIIESTDATYVKFQLDTAHYQQGGGDPVQAVKDYANRLLFLHIKDVESPVPGVADPARSYRFVELGRGKVDLKRVFDALREVDFSGWAIVELDAVPDPARTPKESAMINKKYLEDVLRVTI
jgi:inosose dehydratase